jgi:integrase
MLNCGMTQKDIADMDLSELDWEARCVTRKRSKTKDHQNVPVVRYKLWPETLRLLRQERTRKQSGPVLLNDEGKPLYQSAVKADGGWSRIDNVRRAFERLPAKTGIKKPLKSLKKTVASMIRDNPSYASVENLYLGHAPRTMSDKHYTMVPQMLLDDAIAWAGRELGIVPAADSGEQEEPQTAG